MAIIDLEKLRPQYKGTGALDDTRSPEEKAKDYQLKEIVSVAKGINFSPTSPERWKIYPRRDQAQSNTCVAQTIAKMGGILREQKTGEFIEYSATPIYQKRVNKPSAGMVGTDALDLWRADGLTLDYLVPSQKQNDAEVEAQPVNEYERQIGGISKLDAYVMLPIRDFDTMISTLLATGKPLMAWFKWDYAEWDIEVPTLKTAKPIIGGSFEGHHSITITPNVGIYQGQQGTTLEDSWGARGINGLGVRWLTRDFFNARNTFIAYPTTFKSYGDMGVDPAKPRHSFTRNLSYGMERDADVIALQDILKYEGLFPANVDSTGNYYEITRKAVLAYQNKHGVPTDGLEGRLVGVKTRKALNDMYA